MSRSLFRLTLAALAVAACAKSRTPPAGVPPPDANQPNRGQSSFKSANKTSSGAKDAAGAAGGTATPGTSNAGAPRTVEEADIDKLDPATGRLYALNSWRGLMVIDVSNPDAPSVAGRAPIYGYPVEMYVSGNVAYLVVSDYFDYWAPPAADLAKDAIVPRHGSLIVAVDTSIASAPQVLGTVYLDGEVSQTRKVGDVIYAVSNRYSWYGWYGPGSTDNKDETYVASIDISNPQAIHEVGRLVFPGTGFQVNATPTQLYVAQTSGDWPHYETNVQLVDISDAHGAITPLAQFAVPGSISLWSPQARFALDTYTYPARQCDGCFNGTTFRIVTHDGGWSNGGPEAGAQRLTVFDVTDTAKIHELSHVDLPQTGWLSAARFEGPRAYLVTQVEVDPLSIVDLADPATPRLSHGLELPGTLTTLEPRGNRLVALGSSSGSWSGIALSLYDVTDAMNPTELSRVDLTTSSGYGWSGATYDDKSLRILDDQGLVIVPISGYDQTWQQYRTGLQLVDYASNSLARRGFVTGTGEVQRAYAAGRRIVSTSQTDFATLNIDDRDHPALVAHLTLARDVEGFAALPSLGKGLEYVPGQYYGNGASGAVARLLPLAAADDSGPATEIQLASTWGRLVHVTGSVDRLLAVGQNAKDPSGGTLLEVIDPAAAKVVGSLPLPAGIQTWSYDAWGDAEAVLQLGGGLVAFQGWQWNSAQDPNSQYGYTSWVDHALYIVDVTNAAAPSLVSSTKLRSDAWYGFRARGSTLYTSHFEADPPPAGQSWSNTGSYYVDRLDISNPASPQALPKINVPGLFVDASADGKTLYTVDFQWTDVNDAKATNSFDALLLDSDTAYLLSSVQLAEGIDRITVVGSTAYATTHPWWFDMPTGADWNAWYRQTTLRALDLSDPANVTDAKDVAIAGRFTLRATSPKHLLLQLGYGWMWGGAYGVSDGASGGGVATPGGAGAGCFDCGYWDGGQGLAAYSIASPLAPTFEAFHRTQGWTASLELVDDTAYIAAGMYGTETFKLK